MSSEFDKPLASPRRGRLAFLRTKQAIAVLTVLVIGSIVLIALGATHVLSPQTHHSISNDNSIGDSLGSSGRNNGDSGNGNNVGSGSNGSNGDGGGLGDESTHGSGHTNSTSGGGHEGSTDDSDDNKGPPKKKPSTWQPDNSSSIADGTPLRIMCLGASIVKGETSPDSNGFRKTLRAELADIGASINMVGSQRYGDMPDNDFEAYGGFKVSQIHERSKPSVSKLRPNIFVINVGTNNVLQRKELNVAGKDMEAFIDDLLEASPRSTVVLSTLLTNTVPNREPLILDLNRQFREVFKKYDDKPVVLAEQHPSEGLPGVPQVADIGPDGSHPLESGYEIMGSSPSRSDQRSRQEGIFTLAREWGTI
ncbi:hypothetical protein NUW58_g8070 [Xylaria curta]|uniref:Uncharacterized protein n=1 Tax=Xylaria curta TaxID=42375 RepID=A0ACC1NBU7_9PEZI|nr:hypothetical protein NUW58_g8070 [Xylaria curta]